MSNGLLYAQAVAAEIRGEAAKRRVQAKTIGEALGVSENAISRRMTGKLPFRIDELAVVAEVLDCRISDLLPTGKVTGESLIALAAEYALAA